MLKSDVICQRALLASGVAEFKNLSSILIFPGKSDFDVRYGAFQQISAIYT